MYRILFCSLGCILLLSCETQISNAYILETNSEVHNSVDLASIESDLNSLMMTQGSSERYTPKRVALKDAISELFDPENSPCPLPKKVKKKLNKLKEKGQSWAPAFVKNQIESQPDSATLIDRENISVLLHRVKITSEAKVSRSIVLIGAPTFSNFNISKYLVSTGFNNFLYNLDCSGYLNAAIEGSLTVPGADIKSSAKSALEIGSSMFIGGGVILSPVALAFYGDEFGTRLDTTERISVLEKLLAINGLNDSDEISISESFDAIWLSKEGESSFNGRGSFSGGGGFGLGIFKVSGKAGAGGKLSRESSYSSFQTYLIKKGVVADVKPFKVSEAKSVLADLKI